MIYIYIYIYYMLHIIYQFAEHIGVSDNQLLFGVLESLFLLSFSRYGGAAGGASGPRILRVKGPYPTLIFMVDRPWI